MPNKLQFLIATACMSIANLAAAAQAVPPYSPRFDRQKPVVAVIGDNKGTELTDFVIPYGVLARSQLAEVVAVATRAGRIQMTPATVQIDAQATIAQFDARFPDGADYIIVPKVSNSKDPQLLGWIAAQSAKGATVVSICDGALAVANTGLMKGLKATAHWATEEMRKQTYPDVMWVSNTRYVADGKIVSSAGISAAIPTSLALVEAIGGHAAAKELAARLGVADWSANHNSDRFQLGFGSNRALLAHLQSGTSLSRRAQSAGVEISPGVDEIAMALTLDAYSRTGRSHAYALAASPLPVKTRHGLTVYPERWQGGTEFVDFKLPTAGDMPSARVFNNVLDEIGQRYGVLTAAGVALVFEYPR